MRTKKIFVLLDSEWTQNEICDLLEISKERYTEIVYEYIDWYFKKYDCSPLIYFNDAFEFDLYSKELCGFLDYWNVHTKAIKIEYEVETMQDYIKSKELHA